MSNLEALAASELQRREKRNVRDRLARHFIRAHPDLVDNPDLPLEASSIPEGTTEAAIRGIARFYHNMKEVRRLLRERDGKEVA